MSRLFPKTSRDLCLRLRLWPLATVCGGRTGQLFRFAFSEQITVYGSTLGHTRKLDKGGAVDGVLAIITSIMMPAAHIHGARVDKGVERCFHAGQGWRGVSRIVFITGSFFGQHGVDLAKSEGHIRHFRRGQMAGAVSEAGPGKFIGGPAPLVVNAQGIGGTAQ